MMLTSSAIPVAVAVVSATPNIESCSAMPLDVSIATLRGRKGRLQLRCWVKCLRKECAQITSRERH